MADRVEIYFLKAFLSFRIAFENEAEEKSEESKETVIQNTDYSGFVV